MCSAESYDTTVGKDGHSVSELETHLEHTLSSYSLFWSSSFSQAHVFPPEYCWQELKNIEKEKNGKNVERLREGEDVAGEGEDMQDISTMHRWSTLKGQHTRDWTGLLLTIGNLLKASYKHDLTWLVVLSPLIRRGLLALRTMSQACELLAAGVICKMTLLDRLTNTQVVKDTGRLWMP